MVGESNQSEIDKIPILYGWYNCHREGWILLNAPDTSVFVECPLCRNELAYAYCPACDLITNFLAHSPVRKPDTWMCIKCKKEYTLDPTFYDNPVTLHHENDLPDDVKSRM